MNSTEKEISYQTTNSYSTLNTLTPQTKNVWFACHGMGYLSRYFLKYFKTLNPDENYIVAPQAPSKYYIPPNFKHVGSSWLTKENTIKETENIMRYFDAVFQAEKLTETSNLIVLGYSQGVSVAMRYLAKCKISCAKLILLSGGIPKELTPQDFDYLSTEVHLSYGTQDEYLNAERIAQETARVYEFFGEQVTITPFDGNHKVNVDLLKTLA